MKDNLKIITSALAIEFGLVLFFLALFGGLCYYLFRPLPESPQVTLTNQNIGAYQLINIEGRKYLMYTNQAGTNLVKYK